jgi:hypothetical protein
MNSMIQTSNTTYYTVIKYKGFEDILLPSTHGKGYNLGEILHSNYRSINEWIDVCKENCKRFIKVQSKKKVISQPITEILIKKARRKSYKDNDKLLYQNKINHPNYNPFSPLFEDEIKGKPRSATMADEIARKRFLKAMNGNYADDPTEPSPTTNDNPSSTATNNDNQANHSDASTTVDTTDPTSLETNQASPAIADVASGKKRTTNIDDLLASVSDTHAPKHLTWESEYKPRSIDNLEGNQDHNFALVVRIGQKKDNNLKFNEARILTSILTSLQKVSPYIKITPHDKERLNVSDLESPEQIIFNEEFYSRYLEDPITTIKHHFICRIHFSSKKPFFWFKKNIFFQKWLSQENIRLEENNLQEIHCPKVGFLTQCHPRASLIKVFEERIKQSFKGCQYPPFYCSIEYISVRQTTTKVVVIRSAEKDVSDLLDLFKKSTRINFYTFIPWREWNAMISPKQLDLIQRQNKNITNSKSIIVSGFKDNDTVKFDYTLVETDDMIFTTDTDDHHSNKKENPCSVTVDEFLYKHYKDCDGNELFTYIYPVTLGIREILVQHHHAKEVIELCKVIKQDMYSYMSFDAADEIFENAEEIQDKMINHSRWEPFQTPTNYKEAHESPVNNDKEVQRKHQKRPNNSDTHDQQKPSYAQTVSKMAKQSTNTISTPAKQYEKPTAASTAQNKSSDEINLFRKELLELKEKQKEFETKQEKTNNHMLTELKSTNDTINNKVLVTIEKTSDDISDIRTQMIAMEHLTSQVQHILNFMNSNIQKEKAKLRNINDDMVIDKDANKRNIQGILRDEDGHTQINEHNKENITAGGNQNKCNYNEIDYVGTHNP